MAIVVVVAALVNVNVNVERQEQRTDWAAPAQRPSQTRPRPATRAEI